MTDTEALLTLRERLARLEHEQWCTWSQNINESERISGARRDRWSSLWVDYDELPESVKDQDREWADKVLSLLAPSERGRALEAALWDARAALVAEHGHDGDAYAPWPSCLPVHIALNRARAALAQPQASPVEEKP